MFDSDELRHEEAGVLLCSLDEMGFGEWRLEHMAGGCYVLVCELSDGRVVYVSGDDVLSWVGCPDEFGGSVAVGVYASFDAVGDDECDSFVRVPLAVGDRSAVGVSVAVFGVLSELVGVEL